LNINNAVAQVLGMFVDVPISKEVKKGSSNFTILITKDKIPSFVPDGTYPVKVMVYGYKQSDTKK
jgi:type III secretory pathway component EscR